jgi:hypothetical protein
MCIIGHDEGLFSSLYLEWRIEGIYVLPPLLDTGTVCYKNAQWGSGQSNVN